MEGISSTQASARKLAARARRRSVERSGWNCTPQKLSAPHHRRERRAVVDRGQRRRRRPARRSCARSRGVRHRRQPVAAADRAARCAGVFQPMCGTGQSGRGAQPLDAAAAAGPGSAVSPSAECSNSSCMPRQMPSSGTRSCGSAAIAAPARAAARMASAAAPTPGSSTRGAAAISAGSLLTSARAPSRSSA